MPTPAPYIPAKDSALNSWAANFSTLITATPSAYGLTTSDATTIASEVAAWNTAYNLVLSPSTKTKTTVAAKDTAKVLLLSQLRPYAIQISLNQGVTAANKTAVGVNPRTNTPTPVPAPTTAPVLTADSTSTAGTIIRYRDTTSSPSVKSKPFGAIAIEIWGKSSTTPITDPSTLDYLGSQTKSPFTQVMGSTEAGKTVYFAGRWVTRKNLTGPWSAILPYVVAG